MLIGVQSPITCICIQKINGKKLIICGTQDGHIILWDAKIKRILTKLQAHKSSVLQVCHYKDNLYSQGRDGFLHRYNITADLSLTKKDFFECCISSFCPFDYVYIGEDFVILIPSNSSSSQISAVNVAGFKIMFSLNPSENKSQGMVMSIKSNNTKDSPPLAFSAYENGSIYSWHLATPSQFKHVLHSHKETITSIDFCFKTFMGVSAFADEHLCLWSYKNSDRIAQTDDNYYKRKRTDVIDNYIAADVASLELENTVCQQEIKVDDKRTHLKETKTADIINNSGEHLASIADRHIPEYSTPLTDYKLSSEGFNTEMHIPESSTDYKLSSERLSTETHPQAGNSTGKPVLNEEPSGFKLITGVQLESGVGCASFRDDGRILAVGNWDGTLNVFTGKKLRRLFDVAATVDDKTLSCVRFYEGELFVAGNDGCVGCWELYMDHYGRYIET